MFFAFFSISVALAQNTMGITTTTTMAAADGNGPLASHMRPCAPHGCIKWMGNNPLSLRMYFEGRLRVCMVLKVLVCSSNDALPQDWSVLRAIHTLNSPQNYIHLLGGLSTIHSMHWIGAQGLMWGTRGSFPMGAAMVCCGCVGRCWLLEADVSSTNCRNSKNCLRKYFFHSYVDPIHSWHLTCRLNKEDLDLCTWNISWFLCPIFYGVVYLEEPIGYPAHTKLISLSVCLSVRPSVMNTKTSRIFT